MEPVVDGSRLHYQLLDGSGPKTGWVTVQEGSRWFWMAIDCWWHWVAVGECWQFLVGWCPLMSFCSWQFPLTKSERAGIFVSCIFVDQKNADIDVIKHTLSLTSAWIFQLLCEFAASSQAQGKELMRKAVASAIADAPACEHLDTTQMSYLVNQG